MGIGEEPTSMTTICSLTAAHGDVTVSVWLSRDPIGERGGLNLYGYVQNSPVIFVDADGRAMPSALVESILSLVGLGIGTYVWPDVAIALFGGNAAVIGAMTSHVAARGCLAQKLFARSVLNAPGPSGASGWVSALEINPGNESVWCNASTRISSNSDYQNTLALIMSDVSGGSTHGSSSVSFSSSVSTEVHASIHNATKKRDRPPVLPSRPLASRNLTRFTGLTGFRSCKSS